MLIVWWPESIRISVLKIARYNGKIYGNYLLNELIGWTIDNAIALLLVHKWIEHDFPEASQRLLSIPIWTMWPEYQPSTHNDANYLKWKAFVEYYAK